MALLNVVIDLSHHNTLTARGFHDMQEAGIKAVIHKATEGLHFVDPDYGDRRGRAATVGMMWGAYHFGIAGSPKSQADHFLATIEEHPEPPKMLVLDFEPNPTQGTMKLAEAETFVSYIEQKTGRFPMVYSGQAFLKEKLGNKTPGQTVLSKCPLWIARYSPNGQLPVLPPAFAKFTLWQYTDGAAGQQPHRVEGVVGRVDRNKFNGTMAELTSLFS